MFEAAITTDFGAAHCLPNYPGKCSRLHGHNWKVEVTVSGTELNSLGMLVDFRELKQEVNKVIELLDHYYLNDLDFFQHTTPTTENIAKFICVELRKSSRFSHGVSVKSVRVWESQGSWALYY